MHWTTEPSLKKELLFTSYYIINAMKIEMCHLICFTCFIKIN